ncbi:MAG: hypothetical protein N2314_04265 [Brevinematales bacterium]|nr:hypothetical protein [Brevinematales bacterium]
MNHFWEKLWFWTTMGLASIVILVAMSVLLPVLFFLALPFFLMAMVWLLSLWLRGLKKENSATYDEQGARYTKATILSKESSTQELFDGKDKSSS